MRVLQLYVCLALAAVFYVGWRAMTEGPGRDATCFYYASRLLFTGRNPYDGAEMLAEWRCNRGPQNRDTPPSPFVYPPLCAVLFAPIAPLPARLALRAFALLNYLSALLCVYLLCRMAGTVWSNKVRLLFSAYVLLLPMLMRVLFYGQSTLVVCLCMAGALYAFSRKKDVWAGVLFGLALAKPTLPFIFVGVLAYRRHWKAFGVTVAVFLLGNLLLAWPLGVMKTVASYRAAVHATNGPGGMNDPSDNGSLGPEGIIDAERGLYVLIGPHPPVVKALLGLFILASLAACAYLFRPQADRKRAFEHPLEISVAMMAALALVYHRNYDLAALMFVIYGLIDYRLRYPERQTHAWLVTMALLLVLSFGTSGTRWSWLQDHALIAIGLSPTPQYAAVLVVCLFGCLLWLLYQDRKRYGAISDAALPTNRESLSSASGMTDAPEGKATRAGG